MPLDPNAVEVANRRLWVAHPELRGRALPPNPEDASLRTEWLNYYRQTKLGGAEPLSDDESDSPAGEAAQSCPLRKTPTPRRFLCVRSNVAVGVGSPGLTAGHSM